VNIEEAKAECLRWLSHLGVQRARSEEMQRLAARRREGTIDAHDAKRELAKLDRGVTVYDGAKLEQAVKVLLKHV